MIKNLDSIACNVIDAILATLQRHPHLIHTFGIVATCHDNVGIGTRINSLIYFTVLSIKYSFDKSLKLSRESTKNPPSDTPSPFRDLDASNHRYFT